MVRLNIWQFFFWCLGRERFAVIPKTDRLNLNRELRDITGFVQQDKDWEKFLEIFEATQDRRFSWMLIDEDIYTQTRRSWEVAWLSETFFAKSKQRPCVTHHFMSCWQRHRRTHTPRAFPGVKDWVPMNDLFKLK